MTKTSAMAVIVQPEYRQFVEELKARVIAARISAARAVNDNLIALYWDIGRGIALKQQLHGWGDSVVQSVAADLKRAFPDMAGFSPANVWRMRQLHQTYSSGEFLAQLAREIDQQTPRDQPKQSTQCDFLAQAVREMVAAVPWGHHALLLGRVSGSGVRPAQQGQPDRRGHLPTANHSAPRSTRQAADRQTTGRRGAGHAGARGRMRMQAKSTPSPRTTCTRSYQKNSELLRWCQPPTAAKDLLADFWRLEKEAETMLEGLAK